MSQEIPAINRPRPPGVRVQDRVLDAVALLTLATGVLIFAVGRVQLNAIAENAYQPPPHGVTWVSRAEHHDAQTKWGALIACAGLILSAGAAIKHASSNRRSPK